MLLSRYIPQNAQEIKQEQTGHVVYLYENRDAKPCAIAYGGKRKKSDWAYSFKNYEQREEYVNKYLQDRINIQNQKEQEKIEAKKRKEAEIAEVKVGDIFVCSWGYEQTNVDAYQIIELKGKKATFREIGLKALEATGPDAQYVTPVKDAFLENAEPFVKILQGKHIKLSSFQYAYKMESNDKKYYNSWYY